MPATSARAAIRSLIGLAIVVAPTALALEPPRDPTGEGIGTYWDGFFCDIGDTRFCAALLKKRNRVCVVHRDSREPLWCVRVTVPVNQAMHDGGIKAAASPDANFLVVQGWTPIYRANEIALVAYRDGKEIWRLRAGQVVEERDAFALKGEEEETWIGFFGFAAPRVLAVVTGSGLIRKFDVETSRFLSEWALPHSKAEAMRTREP